MRQTDLMFRFCQTLLLRAAALRAHGLDAVTALNPAPMRRRIHLMLHRWRLRFLLAGGLALAWIGPATAAEIGQIRTLSHIGQNLLAEVEITALSAEEQQHLQARLAVADTYRLGNIRRNPVLNSVRLLLRQQEGRHLVILQSSQPVHDSYLNIYLELGDGRNHVVRQLTLWLEADPAAPPSHSVASSQADEEAELPRAQASREAPEKAEIPAASHASQIEAAPPVIAAAAARQAHAQTRASAPGRNALPQCGKELQQAQHAARRCAAIAQENDFIATQLDSLDDKVAVLKRVILADEGPAAAPLALPSPPATPMPMAAKSKKPQETMIPLRILLISAGVFFGVALLSFLLLTVRSKWQEKRKKTKAKAPAAKPKAEPAQAEAGPETGEAPAEAAPPRAGWRGKLDRMRTALRRSKQNMAAGPARLLAAMRSAPAAWLAGLRAKFKKKDKVEESKPEAA
ncbi:hypothetical protein V8J88_17985 [Massilia sp. W12]|uniref:type IV pilus assembly protein FimV n=1 Tax=Massilia sp. W12 TaxID=3126507 RepID=UPI0030D1F7ED